MTQNVTNLWNIDVQFLESKQKQLKKQANKQTNKTNFCEF